LPREGFLETLREVTEKYGVVLIFDEIITGFRLALGGAQEYYHVTPDLTTLGKILGGGFPMAAFAGKREIMNMIAPSGKVYQAGTYSGNPISVSAGLALLKFLKGAGEEFYSKMECKCAAVVEPLKKKIVESNLKLQVSHLASMFQLFFTDKAVYDYTTAKAADNKKFMEFHQRLLTRGIFLPPSQYETCFISAAHSDEDLRKTLQEFTSSLALE
jgi:glutamate-1-semialdehyde 2,1-aminomutase